MIISSSRLYECIMRMLRYFKLSYLKFLTEVLNMK